MVRLELKAEEAEDIRDQSRLREGKGDEGMTGRDTWARRHQPGEWDGESELYAKVTLRR